MNRRIEDVKINNKKIIRVPKDDLFIKDQDNHNPTHHIEESYQNDSSKYDFLDKRSKKTTFTQRIPQTPKLPEGNRPFSKKILFLFIISLIIGVSYLLSTVFLTANIHVVSKNKTFDLKNQKFTAGKLKTTNIPFELMVVSDSEYKNTVLTSSKEASDKAKGEIYFYNEYSTKPQKLVAGTFVSDESGKTYKIDSSVSIPGYTLDKTKKVIPGQVFVGLTAFLPGELYNGEPESFTINSFKGTDKYKKIYGKTKTPLSGGMTGLVYLLSDVDKESISTKVSSLKDKLLRKLNAQVPDGYVLYPDSIVFSSEIGEGTFSKTPDTKIEMKGTLSAVLLKESELSSSIINKLLPEISLKEKAEILPPDIANLSFDFVDKNQVVNKDIESFDFELNGSVSLKWKPYTEELRSALIGKEKNNVTSIFKQDPGISSASVKIIPFWSKKLPEDIKNINIILK